MQCTPVDIIVPVYGGKLESLACLHSVIESLPRNRSRATLLVIFDAGPDQSLRSELLELASRKKITLLINETNIGFIRSVNLGMNQHPDRDVLLLNSDTMVANDWLDRMIEAAYGYESIATVTPFSNNAEICSWPRICESNVLPESRSVAEIDRAFSELGSSPVEIPTAVGFCMFIKRDCMDTVGTFNAAVFGRGYGEENDFCMRATARGYRHLLANNVFVFHHGGVSFCDEKKMRVENAIKTLNGLYPQYASLVATHIDDDPARKWRYAAELACSRNSGLPLILHISHGIGGGTDKHVVELTARMSANAQHAMLVPQGDCMRLVFPNVITGGLFEFAYDKAGELERFLRRLNLARVHVHHVKGWESRLETLLAEFGVPFDVTIHDYYYLHVNPALTDARGHYCSLSAIRDRFCAEAIPFPEGVTAPAWRRKWASLLRRAERVFAPSRAAAEIYHSYFPDLNITCAFHPDWELDTPYPSVVAGGLQKDEALHVVVLGALSLIKGADVMEKVAVLAAERGAPIRFTLVGYAYKKMAGAVTTLGSYSDAELPAILRDIEPHLVWFPCTWPETYSYTLSHALSLGCPVLCPNLGAFPERLQNRPLTWIADWQSSSEQLLEQFMHIHSTFSEREHVEEWLQQPLAADKEFRYATDYASFPLQEAAESGLDWEQMMECWLPRIVDRKGINRWLLRKLLWLNNHFIFGAAANIIPMHVRRNVKRKLSTRPLHE